LNACKQGHEFFLGLKKEGKMSLQGTNMEINGLNLNVPKGDIAQIFDMFDKLNPTKNYMVPPLED